MNLIKSLTIKNFKGIRTEQKIELLQGSYIVGSNNSGKTSILQAIEFFFSNKWPENELFLNKSEYLAKKEGYNKSEIILEFNIEACISKERKKRLIDKYGQICKISKIFTFRERAQISLVNFRINNGVEINAEEVDPDLKILLESVKVTYLHPQDGIELLERAQGKLKSRLILNWGRRGEVTTALEKIKSDWQSLRESADGYLSRALSVKLQQIWPGCEVKVNLPRNVEDIIKISDIGIKGTKNLPEISLTSQGTGAQSMILYLAHFLLDSDRSLHRGEYHPLWLLEEPESFMHADLIFQLGRQLASQEWLNNIQIVVSTHSPIILASSRESAEQIEWSTIKNYNITNNKPLVNWTSADIMAIGHEMGDSNFEAYFTYAENKEYFFFLEDSRIDTKDAFERSGFNVTKGLNGTSEISKYIVTYPDIVDAIKKDVFFVIDADLGKKDFLRYLTQENLLNTKGNIQLYKISNYIYFLLLQEGFSVEDLFVEFDNFLLEKVALLYKFDKRKNRYIFVNQIPANLSKTHVKLREMPMPNNLIEAKKYIKNTKDIKDLFWAQIMNDKLKISEEYVKSLKELMRVK